MEEAVKKYLTQNYILLLSTKSSYRLFDKNNKDYPLLTNLNWEIYNIFSITPEQFNIIWSLWVDEEIVRLNKKIELTNNWETLLPIDEINKLIIQMI
jgi:hypothetical protein